MSVAIGYMYVHVHVQVGLQRRVSFVSMAMSNYMYSVLLGGRLPHMYNIHSIPVHTCMYIHTYLYESQDSEGWLNSQRDDASDYGQYTNHWGRCLP